MKSRYVWLRARRVEGLENNGGGGRGVHVGAPDDDLFLISSPLL